MYRKMHSDPVPIEIRVFKVKNGRIIINEMLILTRSGQEKTAARFRVKSDGSITVLKPLFSPIAARILGDPL